MSQAPFSQPVLPVSAVVVPSVQLIFPEFRCTLATMRVFREAINSLFRLFELPHEAFHNRQADGSNHYHFPCVQYQPYLHRGQWVGTIVALDTEGKKAIESLLTLLDTPLLATKLDKMGLGNYIMLNHEQTVQMLEKPRAYTVHDFVLNQRQAAAWQVGEEPDKILVPALRFALFGFLNSVGFVVPNQSLQITITDIPNGTKQVLPPLNKRPNHKNKGKLLLIDIVFEANIALPVPLSVGIHKAFGFGRVF